VEKRFVSGMMLTLLLISISTLAFDIQPVDTAPETSENYDEEGKNWEVRIVQHRTSSLELEELKRKLGILEQGGNYNLKIDGHGTGLRPPTEEEWREIADSTYFVEKILLVNEEDAPSSIDHTAGSWFPPIGDHACMDDDGHVDLNDLAIFAGNYGKSI
jgi:hypothetical protein